MTGRHIMIDIEILGTRPGSVILSIGAVEFDLEETKKFWYRNIDLLSSLLAGLTVDEDTIKWWARQTRVALGVLFTSQHKLDEALEDFSRFIGKNDFLWAKGPDFDLVMIQEAYRKLGRKIPWSFRNARDVRTILALGRQMGLEDVPFAGTKHHALDDACHQAEQIMKVCKALGKDLC